MPGIITSVSNVLAVTQPHGKHVEQGLFTPMAQARKLRPTEGEDHLAQNKWWGKTGTLKRVENGPGPARREGRGVSRTRLAFTGSTQDSLQEVGPWAGLD